MAATSIGHSNKGFQLVYLRWDLEPGVEGSKLYRRTCFRVEVAELPRCFVVFELPPDNKFRTRVGQYIGQIVSDTKGLLAADHWIKQLPLSRGTLRELLTKRAAMDLDGLVECPIVGGGSYLSSRSKRCWLALRLLLSNSFRALASATAGSMKFFSCTHAPLDWTIIVSCHRRKSCSYEDKRGFCMALTWSRRFTHQALARSILFRERSPLPICKELQHLPKCFFSS